MPFMLFIWTLWSLKLMLLFYVSIIYRLELIISTSLNVLASFFQKQTIFKEKS